MQLSQINAPTIAVFMCSCSPISFSLTQQTSPRLSHKLPHKHPYIKHIWSPLGSDIAVIDRGVSGTPVILHSCSSWRSWINNTTTSTLSTSYTLADIAGSA